MDSELHTVGNRNARAVNAGNFTLVPHCYGGSSYGGQTSAYEEESDKRPWSYGGTSQCLLAPPIDKRTLRQMDEFEDVINRMASMSREGSSTLPNENLPEIGQAEPHLNGQMCQSQVAQANSCASHGNAGINPDSDQRLTVLQNRQPPPPYPVEGTITTRSPHTSPRPSPYPPPLTPPTNETSSSSAPRRSSVGKVGHVPVSPVRIHVTAPWDQPRTRLSHCMQ